MKTSLLFFKSVIKEDKTQTTSCQQSSSNSNVYKLETPKRIDAL